MKQIYVSNLTKEVSKHNHLLKISTETCVENIEHGAYSRVLDAIGNVYYIDILYIRFIDIKVFRMQKLCTFRNVITDYKQLNGFV